MQLELPCCHKCGARALVATWVTFSNQTRHIRGDCAACRQFSHFLPQNLASIRAADKNGDYVNPRAESQGGLFDDAE